MALHPHQGSGCRAGPICAARTGLAMLLMIIPVTHPSGASVAHVPWFKSPRLSAEKERGNQIKAVKRQEL